MNVFNTCLPTPTSSSKVIHPNVVLSSPFMPPLNNHAHGSGLTPSQPLHLGPTHFSAIPQPSVTLPLSPQSLDDRLSKMLPTLSNYQPHEYQGRGFEHEGVRSRTRLAQGLQSETVEHVYPTAAHSRLPVPLVISSTSARTVPTVPNQWDNNSYMLAGRSSHVSNGSMEERTLYPSAPRSSDPVSMQAFLSATEASTGVSFQSKSHPDIQVPSTSSWMSSRDMPTIPPNQWHQSMPTSSLPSASYMSSSQVSNSGLSMNQWNQGHHPPIQGSSTASGWSMPTIQQNECHRWSQVADRRGFDTHQAHFYPNATLANDSVAMQVACPTAAGSATNYQEISPALDPRFHPRGFQLNLRCQETTNPDHWVPPSDGYNPYLSYEVVSGQIGVPEQWESESGHRVDGVLSQPYGADPINPNNESHDSDRVWHSIPLPQAGTAALEQLGATPAGSKTPHMTVSPTATSIPPEPPFDAAITPLELILTRDKKCNYIGPDGKPCGENMVSKKNSSIARHWLNCHAIKELKAVRSRKLSMSHATIINTIARKLVAERYIVTCPLETCMVKGTPRADFSSRYSLIRHMSNGSLHMEMPMSKSKATEWAHTNMTTQATSNDFTSIYEEAVWSICRGY